MSKTIEQIQRDGLPGDAGDSLDGVRYEDLDDAACDRLQDSFYARISGSLDLFADVVEAMQAEGDKRAELERRIIRSLYEDMDSAMQSQWVTLDRGANTREPAERLRAIFPTAEKVAYEHRRRQETRLLDGTYTTLNESEHAVHVYFNGQIFTGTGETIEECIKRIMDHISAMSIGIDQAMRLRGMVEQQKRELMGGAA